MTREEAKKMLKAKLECLKHETSGNYFDCNRCNCDECSLNYEQGNMGEQIEALDMAIKALEQQPKTGHWIEGQTDNPNIHNILCSCCFEGYPSKGHANSQYTREKFQWCPKCGSRMIESQESEKA